MTKFRFILLFFLIGLPKIYSQAYEFGAMFGGGNYIGDIGREYYFYPNKIGGGIVFKRTLNPWMSMRLNLNYFQIEARDADAESLGRQARNLSVNGQIINFSTGIEYNFIPRNPFIPLKSLKKLTPYLFVGVGLSNYSGKLYQTSSNQNYGYEYNGASLNIPMILGLKYKFTHHFLISLETGAYYHFTDNLDGTGAYYKNMDAPTKQLTPTTNTNSNDWFTFSSIGLIYTFGDLNCYFNLR